LVPSFNKEFQPPYRVNAGMAGKKAYFHFIL